MNVRYFRSSVSSWESLFADAASFATRIGPRRVVSLSHSEDRNNGVVGVWYSDDADRSEPAAARARLAFECVRGTWASWEQLFERAAEFASQLEPDRIVSICHSCDQSDGLVTVWFWE